MVSIYNCFFRIKNIHCVLIYFLYLADIDSVESEDTAPEEDSNDSNYEPESEGEESDTEPERMSLSKKVVSGRGQTKTAGPLKFDNNNIMARKMSAASSSRATLRHDLDVEMAQNVIPLPLLTPPAGNLITSNLDPVSSHMISIPRPLIINDGERRSQSLPTSSMLYSRRSHVVTWKIYF